MYENYIGRKCGDYVKVILERNGRDDKEHHRHFARIV